jgi:uncharacterized protein
MLRCPVCQTEMRLTTREGIEIDFCPNCRGVWLDRGELEKLLDGNAAYEAASYKRKNEHPLSDLLEGDLPFDGDRRRADDDRRPVGEDRRYNDDRRYSDDRRADDDRRRDDDRRYSDDRRRDDDYDDRRRNKRGFLGEIFDIFD